MIFIMSEVHNKKSTSGIGARAVSFACRLFLETDVSRENDVTHYFDTIGVLSCGRIFWKVAGEINQITSKHLTGHSL